VPDEDGGDASGATPPPETDGGIDRARGVVGSGSGPGSGHGYGPRTPSRRSQPAFDPRAVAPEPPRARPPATDRTDPEVNTPATLLAGMPEGTLRDTYVAALQHDLVDVADADLVLGVVRRPAGWFRAAVDENEPALAPPEDLLDDVKRRTEELRMAGLCDEEAHNAAWEGTDFAERYRAHLDTDGEAAAATTRLRERLVDGDEVVLVCFENTAKKRCHRTLLAERLSSRGSEPDRSATGAESATDRR
jgi:uncharacterized protein YeaO (DUF488 family)